MNTKQTAFEMIDNFMTEEFKNSYLQNLVFQGMDIQDMELSEDTPYGSWEIAQEIMDKLKEDSEDIKFTIQCQVQHLLQEAWLEMRENLIPQAQAA